MVGDTITRLISPHDKSLIPIFSDCGTTTALVFDPGGPKMDFNISSEGCDHEAIIVPQGGAREPITMDSLLYKNIEVNIERKGLHLAMKGLDVFNFSLKKVSPNVEDLIRKSVLSSSEIDYFVFHQANRLILESISKKLKINTSKVPTSLKYYGNTSGATIPLTIVSNLRRENTIIDSKMVLSGFGVGLSLASAVVDFKNVVSPEICEL